MARRTKLMLGGKDFTLIEGAKKCKALDGVCFHGVRKIYVYSGLRPKDRRETIIHEIIHAVYPGLKESTVLQLGGDIADALCELNLTFKKEWLGGKKQGNSRSRKAGKATSERHQPATKSPRKAARRRSR